MEFCPLCMFRKALADGVESGESPASEDTVKPITPDQAVQRFDDYELVKGEDGKPLELGRGAMGVTYKAFDVDLRCPVAIKVISERYLGDESARLLKAIATVTGALDARRRITRQSLQNTPSIASHVGTRKPPARRGE